MKARGLAVLFAVMALPTVAAAGLWDDPTFGLCAADEYRSGVYIHTDYVFDDRGADTNGTAGGDFTYPSGDVPYRNNAADLVEVRVRPDAENGVIEIGARLNTLYFDHVPVVVIGIDDGSAPALVASWPDGSGLRASGVRWVVTLRKDGGSLTDLSNAQSSVLDVAVVSHSEAERHLENTLSAAIPRSALGLETMPQGAWKLRAAAGLWENGGWARPGGEGVPGAYDVAFVANEAFTNWQQNEQARILAGGDLSDANGVVDFQSFPDRSARVASGRFTRIYRSRLEELTGEGRGTYVLRPVGGAERTIAAPLTEDLYGLYLPYAIWIPAEYDGTPTPLFFEMHGFLGNHLGLGAWANGTIDVPAFGYAPSGRSGSNFYIAEGEADVMEGFEDVKAHYAVDENRVYLSGISMGGFGTYKIAVRYPDVFAAAVPLIGTAMSEESLTPEPIDPLAGERVFSNTMAAGQREWMENLLNVPFRIFNGGIDWLVMPAFYWGDVVRFEELGYDYQFSAFAKRHHETVAEYTNVLYHQVLDGCQPEFEGCDPALDPPGGFVRDPNPARVRFKVYPFHFFPEMGLVYDRAYWVSEVEVRDASSESAFGMIDTTSRALAPKLDGAPERIGPEPRVFAPTSDPYLFLGLRRTATPEPPANAIDVSLRNLVHAAIDLGRAGIGDEDFELTIAGDGPSEISLLGSFTIEETVTVLRNGSPFSGFVLEAGRLVLQDTFGAAATYRVDR